ncbi:MULTISPECIES: MFS transporter [Mycobacterium]|uniref:MFS transporter n=1 Tax=Mycobacterium asiaticum TaxID=1790 RepID=A0A1A3DJF6_MYCAS|nr:MULTISPECIES: MFS transporter [Mycobacterium]OBI98912.1 MFS transporter [Mycobacterium asiaticum]OBJ87781.1 MFS transporter [Mycobacterium asiaticum]TDK88373.1 MFS transporter [Mycobacterium paragordonae]
MATTDASRPMLALTPGQRRTLVVSCLGVALVIGSMAALYTSLSDIAAETGATQGQLTWVVDGYTLAVACLVLPAGAVGDRYGRRAVLIAGLAVFSAASAMPLMVHDPGWLIGSRAVAGIGAAFVMPSTLSIMTAEFPERHRARAVAIWAGVAGSGAILGVLGSGVLLQLWSWQSIFVALTVAGVVLLIAALTVSESLEYAHPAMDYVGSVVVAAAVGLIVIALTEAPQRSWTDPLVLGLFAGGVAASLIFVIVEFRSDHPLLDLRLFADRGFGSATLSIALQFLVLFGVFYLLIQYLQLVVGYEPLPSALALAPVVVPIVGISLVAPWLADRFGLRLLTVPGLLAIAAGIFWASRLDVDFAYTDFLWPLLIMGTGLGLCMAPATAAIVAATPVEKHGVAAAVNDAAREVGAAVGIAIAGSVLAAGYANRIEPALPRLPEPMRQPFSDSLAAALKVADQAGPAGQQLADIAKSAFIDGYERAGLVLSVVTAASAVVLGFWAPGSRSTAADKPHATPASASRESRSHDADAALGSGDGP